MMKSLFEKIYVKFYISEILMLFVNMFVYFVCCLKFSGEVSSIIALIVSLIFDYVVCIKYVFKDNLKKFKYRIILFALFGSVAFLLKHGIIKLFYYNFTLPLIVSKAFGFILIVLFNFFVKCAIFLKNYRITVVSIKDVYKVIIQKWEQFISLKYIRFIFKFLPQNLFVFIFFIFSVYYMLCFFRDNNDLSIYNQVVSDGYIQLMDEDVKVDFSNIEVDADVDKICLVFGTYGRKIDSILLFELYNDKGKKIYNYKLNTNILNDGQGLCLNVPLIDKEKLKDYSLSVIPKGADKDNHVVLFINDETGEPTLYLKRSHDLFCFKYIMILVSMVLFLVLNYYFQKKGKHISEMKCLLLMGCYFILILLLNPPLENPDEPSHLSSSYNLSQNWIYANEKTEIVVPENVECLNYANVQQTDSVVNFDKIAACLKNTDNKKTNSIFGVSNRVTYTFLGHLPQAVSMKIADIFSDSSLFIFLFGRFGNFMISFVILYFAIKISPVGKKLLLFIGLTPMFVQQITSLSYDAILNSVSLLFVAYIIKCFYNKDVLRNRDILIPIIFLLLTITVKVVYVPLSILLLFIPKERFKNKKQRFIYLFSIILFVLLGRYLITDVFFSDIPNGSGIGIMDEQVEYILNNPLKLFPIAIKTFKINGWYYLKGLVGYFCWFRFSLSDIAVVAWIICFGLLILNTKNVLVFSRKKKMIPYQKIIYIIAILISIAAVFASMYFCWSKYALDYVDGVQGRYFIPILGFIAMLFMPKKSKVKFSRESLYTFCNIMLFQYLIYLITYFY